MRLSDPGRVKLWPERYNEQRAKGPNPVNNPTEHFQARGVGPMRILEDHQHRSSACEGLDLRDEGFQRSLSALQRVQRESGVAPVVRKRQHFGKQRGVLDRGRGLRQQRIELVELRLQGVIMREPGSTFHLADDWIKRAVGVLWRAKIA